MGILCILALWSFISLHFGFLGLHFLAFWLFWAFISFHFGLFGVGFWAPPPTSCQKWPVCPTSLQWIYQRRDRLHFAVFSLLGFHFRAFWPCGPHLSVEGHPSSAVSLAFVFSKGPIPCQNPFGLWGFHFLAFWLCGPSFPCILALRALISLHFGLSFPCT